MVHARSALILELVELRHAVLKLNALLKLKHLLGLKLADDSNGILAIDLVTGMHKAVGKRAGGREEKKALGIEVKTAHGHPAGARDAGKTRKDGGTAFRVVTGDDFAGHLVVHQNAGRGGGSHRAAHEPALDTNHVRSRNAVTHGGGLTVDGHDAGGDQSLHVAAGSEPSIGERLLKLFGRQIGRRLLLAGAVDDVERDRTIRKAPVAVGLGLHLSEGLARRGQACALGKGGVLAHATGARQIAFARTTERRALAFGGLRTATAARITVVSQNQSPSEAASALRRLPPKAAGLPTAGSREAARHQGPAVLQGF